MATTTFFPPAGGAPSSGTGILKGTNGTVSIAVEGVDFNVPASPAARALFRARLLLGTTINRVLGTDFDTDQWWATSGATTNTPGLSTTLPGGVLTLAVTAVASRLAQIGPHGDPQWVTAPQTSLWYAYFRGHLATAGDATTVMQFELRGSSFGGPVAAFGLSGSNDTTHWTWQVTDNPATGVTKAALATAVDTNWHDIEIWNDGTNINFGLDLGLQVTTPTASTAKANFGTNPIRPTVTLLNGTGAAARQMDVDAMYMAVVGN